MPAIAWSDLDSRLFPCPAWRFFVTLPTIPGLSTDGTILSFLAQKLVGTHKGIDYEQVVFNATARNFPTGFHTENISVQFVEDQAFDVTTYLRGWIDLVIDENGNYGLPSKYKRPITCQSLAEDGSVINTFGWRDCSPVRPDAFDWDGTQTGFLMTGCSFVTDGAMGPQSGSGGGTGGGNGDGGGATPSDSSDGDGTPSDSGGDDGTPNTNPPTGKSSVAFAQPGQLDNVQMDPVN